MKQVVNYPQIDGATPIVGARHKEVSYDLAPGEAIEVDQEAAIWLKQVYPFLQIVEKSKKDLLNERAELSKAVEGANKDLVGELTKALAPFKVGKKEIETLASHKISPVALVDMDMEALSDINGIGEATLDKLTDFKEKALAKRQAQADKAIAKTQTSEPEEAK